MTMVVSNRQRIHYRFEGDKGAYLLLHHGLFGTQQDWYRAGYVDALRSEFRLILMDARGHGRSDHPLEADAYRLEAFAEDVIAIMDELDIRNLHFCGYSLGALVGFDLLLRHPERMRIVMLAGESPFLSEAVQAEWRALAERIRTEGLDAVREGLTAQQRLPLAFPPTEQEGEQQAALAMLEGLASEAIRPDTGRISVDSPVALFTGEDDPALERVRDARRRIHRARFVSFPGLSHAGLLQERTALMGEMLRLLRPAPRLGEGAPGGEGTRDGRPERSGRSNRGRGRGGRGREEGARTSAPLTPPPPVDTERAGGAVPPDAAAVPVPPAADTAEEAAAAPPTPPPAAEGPQDAFAGSRSEPAAPPEDARPGPPPTPDDAQPDQAGATSARPRDDD